VQRRAISVFTLSLRLRLIPVRLDILGSPINYVTFRVEPGMSSAPLKR